MSGIVRKIVFAGLLLATSAIPSSSAAVASTDVAPTASGGLRVTGDFRFPTLGSVIGQSAVQLGLFLYYIGRDPEHGAELWRTNGSVAGTSMVADITPGPHSTWFNSINAAGGKIWLSDGDASWVVSPSTKVATLITDSGSISAAVENPTDPSEVLLVIETEGAGRELWKSDGTSTGTSILADIYGGVDSSSPRNFVRVGDFQYFVASGPSGNMIYRTDGVNVIALPGVFETPNIAFDTKLANIGGNLVFISGSFGIGYDLWRLDGFDYIPIRRVYSTWTNGVVEAGGVGYYVGLEDSTKKLFRYDVVGDTVSVVSTEIPITDTRSTFTVKEFPAATSTTFFFTNSVGSTTHLMRVESSSSEAVSLGSLPGDVFTYTVHSLVVAASRVYIGVATGAARTIVYSFPLSGGEPTRIPGDLEGDYSDHQNGLPVSLVSGRIVASSAGEFSGANPIQISTGTPRIQLLASNPTILPDVGQMNPEGEYGGVSYATLGGTLYFSAYDPAHGMELWKVPKGATKAVRLKDIRRGNASSNPSELTVAGNKIYFTAETGLSGRELWVTNGSASGTRIVKDIFSGPTSSYPTAFEKVGSEVYFYAGEGELWRSKGTPTSTKRIIADATSMSFSTGQLLKPYNGAMYFLGLSEDGQAIYKVSPSMALAKQQLSILDSVWTLSPAAMLGDKFVYGTFNSGSPSWSLHSVDSDFLDEPTTLPFPELLDGPYSLGDINNKVLMIVNTSSGWIIMRSDGTVSGTGVLKDLDPTSMDDWADPLNAVAGKNLYFLGNTNSRGVELWRTDGTPSGTKLVKDINAGSDSSMNFSSNLVRAAKSVYFGAYDTTDHLRLWKTSGTTRSTRRVDDTVQNVSAMALAGSRVFYLGNKGGQIPYLYVSSVR